MPDPLTLINTRRTPQSVPAAPEQVKNNAGGFVFTIDPMARLRRFLTLGTTGGTYYVSQDALTKDAATVILDLIRTDGLSVVREIVEVSTAGRAPKQNPALFALAAVAGLGDDDARRAALDALPQVARTGTHLFLFAGYVEQFRGWGRGLRAAVGKWYSTKEVDALAYQLVKYQQREGWSHRDLLRLSHPDAPTPEHVDLYDWACGRPTENKATIIEAFERSKVATSLPALIREGAGLSWEMLPSEALNDRKVWEALLEQGVPQTALLRQLPRLTRLGLCDPMTNTATAIAAQLVDPERLRKARVHPISVLIAARTYAGGRSVRGDGEWTPSPVILDALDRAFYAAYGAVTPSGKRTLLALDVSGSMTSPVAGLPISCREASAALALVTAAVEPAHQIVGFTSSSGGWGRDTALTALPISPRQRLDDAIRAVSNLPFGGTDCALPITWALAQGKEIDTFVVLTDNETWAGNIHPHQALKEYRAKTGIPARLVVVAMAPTQFSIADPSDPGMLDISGFDSATPQLLSDFSAGLV